MRFTGSRGRRPLHLIGFVVIVAAFALITALTPQPAQARASYIHGGLTLADCETCHVNAHTWWTPTNEACLGCHPGYKVPLPGLTCWTCHAPGQDMSGVRNDAACTSACHLPDGSTVTHTAHPGRSSACTSCHPVTASPSDPAGSAHHSIAAPTLTGLTPGAGVAGTTVTLTGQHLDRTRAVIFNGVWAAFAVDSDTQITALVPAGATSGLVSVLTPGGKVSSETDFVVTVTPSLKLKARPTRIAVRRRVRMSGLLAPVSLGGAKIAVVVQRRKAGVWRTVKRASPGTTAAGNYTWSYRPLRRGAYRVRASVGETPANTAVRTAWRGFRVK